MPGKVLIVEDEPELLRALRVRFTACRFACETAANGKEGLAVLQRFQPDVIVADLLMPEMDGYEFCQQLKAEGRTAAIPVIVLTAIPQDALDRRADELKAERVLRKPFDSDVLLAMVEELIHPTASGGAPHG